MKYFFTTLVILASIVQSTVFGQATTIQITSPTSGQLVQSNTVRVNGTISNATSPGILYCLVMPNATPDTWWVQGQVNRDQTNLGLSAFGTIGQSGLNCGEEFDIIFVMTPNIWKKGQVISPLPSGIVISNSVTITKGSKPCGG